MGNDVTEALCIAKLLQDEFERIGVSHSAAVPVSTDDDLFDAFVSDGALQKKTKKLFLDGHYARAVEEAYKLIDNMVKKRAGELCSSKSGTGLMREAFSPNKVILKLNDNLSDVDRDEQQGYMDIFAGCMMGIRNPRAHDADLEDQREYALRLLGFADHLILRIRKAEVVYSKEPTYA